MSMSMSLRLSCRPSISGFKNKRDFLGLELAAYQSSNTMGKWLSGVKKFIPFEGYVKSVKTAARISFPKISADCKDKEPSNFLSHKKMVPYSDPPSTEDVESLYEFFDSSTKLVVLTGAGMSTESGIPDYRSYKRIKKSDFFGVEHLYKLYQVRIKSESAARCPVRFNAGRPNGAYSTGFKPITHQEFLRSIKARRRYWARSYAGWRRFTAAQPSTGHIALSSLEKAGHISFMITQNVDRLHHRAGSNPLELHGTVYIVACTNCGFSLPRDLFQDQVKAHNPKWAEAIESLDYDSRSDKSFGMKQRPDGDIEIDEKFWEEDFYIPECQSCQGVLKPDVVFFGDNVPKSRADAAMEAAKGCDAFLVLGSSLMTMSAFRLIKAAREAGAATAIINIGATRADDIVPLKISARVGEILPRLLNVGSLSIPAP